MVWHMAATIPQPCFVLFDVFVLFRFALLYALCCYVALFCIYLLEKVGGRFRFRVIPDSAYVCTS